MRIPKHIGIIPDGNRRWAAGQGMEKGDGYSHGISPGMSLYRMCRELGIEEMSFYGFTVDNTKRPGKQREAFTKACVEAVKELSREDASLLVLGNTRSDMFPPELLPYTSRKDFGAGGMKINFLVNYSWEWDMGLRTGSPAGLAELNAACQDKDSGPEKGGSSLIGPSLIGPALKTAEVSRIELIIRWGGRRRLSGFLPVQSVYSDIYVVDDYWPDFRRQHVEDALKWYSKQDVTLGG